MVYFVDPRLDLTFSDLFFFVLDGETGQCLDVGLIETADFDFSNIKNRWSGLLSPRLDDRTGHEGEGEPDDPQGDTKLPVLVFHGIFDDFHRWSTAARVTHHRLTPSVVGMDGDKKIGTQVIRGKSEAQWILRRV